MLYGKGKDGQDKFPEKQGKAICPQCGGDLIAKCGSQKIWHWSHVSLDCDHWTEPESAWHKNWKGIVPRSNQEITIGAHRADIRLDSGLIIELQNSSISAEEIKEREEFYRDMIWIFNGTKFAKNCVIAECSKARKNKPRYRSTGSSFLMFSDPRFYENLINFERQQDLMVKAEMCFYKQRYSLNGFVSELAFYQKSYVPYIGAEEAIESPCLIDKHITARPIFFRWRWFSSSLASVRKPVLWDVGSNKVLIFFPNGIADIFSQARMLYERRRLKRPSDLCSWVVDKKEVLQGLGVPLSSLSES